MNRTRALLAALGLLFFSSWRLLPLAPLALSGPPWAPLLCGTLADLLASDGRFGLYSLTYLCAYHLARRVPTYLPLQTVIFAQIVSLLYALLRRAPLTLHWILSDLIAMPLLDGLFALVWITLPLWVLYGRPSPERPFELARPK